MIKIQLHYVFLFFIVINKIYSQSSPNPFHEKTGIALTEYFKMDRENIHLHLNKNSYLTDEEIWFKGYIIEKKLSIPFVSTSNVYLNLLDATGQKINTQLYFSENSIFTGKITLNSKLTTGKYYIQVFTNYMNNFLEDESSIFEITIINPTENNYTDTKTINYNEVEITFYPESGTFLEGVSNTVGVKIKDCNDNGIVIKDAEVVDSKGSVISNFSTDQFGYGRFTIVPLTGEQYKAITTIKERKIEKALPIMTFDGITISVNDYTFKDKTTLKLSRNSRSNSLTNSVNTLVIQQNGTANFVSFSFKEDETEKNINLLNDQIMEGINTIHLINSAGKKISERIFYKPYKNINEVEIIATKKNNDSIVFSGKSSMLLSNMSISVLPSESVSNKPEKSIYDTLQFDSFIAERSKNIPYYLNNLTRTKHFELDNYLLSQKSKYKWEEMLENPPQKKYDFDKGLTIKGTVNNTLTDVETHSIIMNCTLLEINETTTLNSKNEFLFENILAVDSTSIYFTLVNKKDKSTELKLYSQILNNKRKFLKPFITSQKICEYKIKNQFVDNTPFPKIRNAILIDSITIVAKNKREKLNNLNNYSNSSAKGYKINEDVASRFRDVLSFIRAHGYDVTIEGVNVSITKQFTTSFLAGKSPAVYLDDVPLTDFSLLLNYNLDSVDEIYVNKIGFGAGINGSNGTIRIYSKVLYGSKGSGIKIKSKPFIVKSGEGFQASAIFENPKYENTRDISFLTHGTIHWEPVINTDENGEFQFSFPNLQQKTLKVVIEGISSDGKLISETKTIIVN